MAGYVEFNLTNSLLGRFVMASAYRMKVYRNWPIATVVDPATGQNVEVLHRLYLKYTAGGKLRPETLKGYREIRHYLTKKTPGLVDGGDYIELQGVPGPVGESVPGALDGTGPWASWEQFLQCSGLTEFNRGKGKIDISAPICAGMATPEQVMQQAADAVGDDTKARNLLLHPDKIKERLAVYKVLGIKDAADYGDGESNPFEQSMASQKMVWLHFSGGEFENDYTDMDIYKPFVHKYYSVGDEFDVTVYVRDSIVDEVSPSDLIDPEFYKLEAPTDLTPIADAVKNYKVTQVLTSKNTTHDPAAWYLLRFIGSNVKIVRSSPVTLLRVVTEYDDSLGIDIQQRYKSVTLRLKYETEIPNVLFTTQENIVWFAQQNKICSPMPCKEGWGSKELIRKGLIEIALDNPATLVDEELGDIFLKVPDIDRPDIGVVTYDYYVKRESIRRLSVRKLGMLFSHLRSGAKENDKSYQTQLWDTLLKIVVVTLAVVAAILGHPELSVWLLSIATGIVVAMMFVYANAGYNSYVSQWGQLGAALSVAGAFTSGIGQAIKSYLQKMVVTKLIIPAVGRTLSPIIGEDATAVTTTIAMAAMSYESGRWEGVLENLAGDLQMGLTMRQALMTESMSQLQEKVEKSERELLASRDPEKMSLLSPEAIKQSEEITFKMELYNPVDLVEGPQLERQTMIDQQFKQLFS